MILTHIPPECSVINSQALPKGMHLFQLLHNISTDIQKNNYAWCSTSLDHKVITSEGLTDASPSISRCSFKCFLRLDSMSLTIWHAASYSISAPSRGIIRPEWFASSQSKASLKCLRIEQTSGIPVPGNRIHIRCKSSWMIMLKICFSLYQALIDDVIA